MEKPLNELNQTEKESFGKNSEKCNDFFPAKVQKG